jgi:hypothetical protein
MEDGFKNILFAFIFMGLIGVLLYTAVIEVSNTYNKNISEIDNSGLGIIDYNKTIKNIEADARSYQESFSTMSDRSGWEIILDIVGFFTVQFFKILVDTFDIVIMPLKITSSLMTSIFNVPTIVSGVLTAVVLFIIIFSVWRLSKQGD